MVAVHTTNTPEVPLNEERHLKAMDEPGSRDCRMVIDAKRSVEQALGILSAMPHTDHIQRQLRSVYSQLEGMHDLKRAGGAGVSFRSADWCSKVLDTAQN